MPRIFFDEHFDNFDKKVRLRREEKSIWTKRERERGGWTARNRNMTSRRTLRRISSKVEAERSNGSKSLFALGPRACWQKNASRREVRGVHNRSGVYPDPSNWRDRLLCFVPTTVLVSEWQLHSSRFTNTPGPLPAVLSLFAECRFLSRRRIRDTADIFTWNSAHPLPRLIAIRTKKRTPRNYY